MRLMSPRLVPAVVGLLVLVASGCGSSDDSSYGSTAGDAGSSASASAGAATAAEGDVEFAQMMIPHHEQAVAMATLALENDTASEDIKALARQIEGAQGPEIQTMQGWLSRWGAVESTGPMDHGSGGMMSDQDLTALEEASGDEFDRMWLTMMIEHHEGAVTMAKDVLATTADTEVEELATAVVEGQRKEIATMQGMLG